MKIEFNKRTVDIPEKYARSLIARGKAKAVKPGRPTNAEKEPTPKK